FDDESVAAFFDEQVDAGRRPETFARLWLHTHPGKSAEPSGTAEATFTRVFGRSDWAVMFILACGGQTYARLQLNVGPGADIKIPVEVNFSRPFAGTSIEDWESEYLANVRTPPPDLPTIPRAAPEPYASANQDRFMEEWWRDSWGEYADFDHYQEENEFDHI